MDHKAYLDGPFNSVNWTNAAALNAAIANVGPVKIGVAADQLHATCQAHNWLSGWVATGYHADTNEDHCVSLFGYGTVAWLAQKLNCPVPAGVSSASPAYAMFTWGSVGIIDRASMVAITQEAWLRQPTTIVI